MQYFIDFPSNSKGNTLLHRIASDYSHADWDGLRDHLRDILWDDTFKLSASAVTEFCECGFRLELMYTLLIANIRSSLTHLHSFQLLVLLPLFREIFFCLYQQNKSSESKAKFRQATNRCKKVLEAAKLACANKTKESCFPDC